MIKHLSFFIIIALFIPVMINAQNKKIKDLHLKTLAIDVPTQDHSSSNTGSVNSPADGDYILVDTMANAFGTGSSSVNPLAYDQMINTVAIVHRANTTYGTGSGELWYNISTDDGVTWTRVASVNSGAFQQQARYPSMAISNSTFGTNAVFAWPELFDATVGWAYVGYGIDSPIGGGNPFADISTVANSNDYYGSEAPIWASDNSDYVFWSTNATNRNRQTLFRTQDYASVDTINPPQWGDAVFLASSVYNIGGVSYQGVQYQGLVAPFTAYPIEDWAIGYSKSTDDGTTWSDFSFPILGQVPGFENFTQIMINDTATYNQGWDGDIQVDYMGRVHLVVAVTDTNTWTHAVVDFYETESGWEGDLVFSGLDRRAYGLGPGLGWQMGPDPLIAMDSSHKVVVVQWINSNPTSGWADIFYSHKRLDDPNSVWSDPVNLTNSELVNNTAAHLAPQIEDNGGGHYTAFSAYAWQLGATGPYSDTTAATGLWVAAVPFDEMPVGINNEVNSVYNFQLAQNYPNPFNPTTQIKYTLAEKSNVILKVYDMLGREITTLINEQQGAGIHTVDFNASNLATGLYIYKIQAGNFSQSKKMMLLK